MKIKITGIPKIKRGLKKLNQGLKKDLLQDIGQQQIQRIVDRAIRGQGFKRVFKRYSSDYGRRTGKTTVDLTQTGKLLNSFGFKVTRNELMIFNKADYHEWVNKDRPFIGFSTKDIKEITKQIGRNVDKLVRRFNK